MNRFILLTIALIGFAPAHAELSNDEIASLFGHASANWGAEISPDGDYVALGCAPLETPSVCIYSLNTDAQPKLFQIPEKTRLTNFYWVGPEHVMIEVNMFKRLGTSSGLRDYTFNRGISYNARTGNSELVLSHEARFLIDSVYVSALLPQEDNYIQMVLPFARTEVYKVNLNSGNAKRLAKQNDEIWHTSYDENGDEIARVEYKRDFEVKLPSGDVIYTKNNVEEAPFYILGTAPGSDDLLVRGRSDELYGLAKLSTETGELEDIEIAGLNFSLSTAIKDLFTNEVIGFRHTDDLTEQTFLSQKFQTAQKNISSVFPNQISRILSWTKDYSVMTFVVEEAGKPKTYYLYEEEGPVVSPLGNLAPRVENQTLGEVLSISYTAEDGLNIPGYLTLPAGREISDGPFPMILMPHGGPEARDTAAFDWWAQAYAAAGYAVLQPNFRGSDGFGEAFRDRGYGEYGGKMITDTLNGYDWAVAEGLAKPGGYCLAGASYGGYAALQGAALGGDNVKCSIAINAVADPIAFMGRANVELPFHRYWREYLGFDRFSSDEEKAKFIPTENARAISAPLLVIHGKEDTTVPFQQALIIEDVFGHRDGFRLIAMDGEDHYLTSTKARQTVLRESLEFLDSFFPTD